MSLMDSKAMLSRATKDLFSRWDDLKSVWSDAQSREFEKIYLAQLEQDVRSAMSALDHMEHVIQKIKSDCE